MNQNIAQTQNKAGNYSYMLINKKYKIGPQLNHGGYGYVYYAQDIEGNRYAIKIFNLKPVNKPQEKIDSITKCLEKEDQFMMVCNSEYIVKCYGALKDQKEQLKFIIMDLCDLGSLEDLIYQKGYLQQQEAKIIFKQILCGLSEIHKQGQIHRDIKSSNVCFHQNRCVLCDFGCAKEFLTESQRLDWYSTIRKKGTVLGTIFIKSPQMLGKKQYGYRTDIWGMGVMLYEMLTGTPPFWFSDDLSDEAALKHIQENIQKIYLEEYIRENLQKRFKNEKRGNYRISQAAQEFLKNLIVFDQKKRAGWKRLASDPYLLQDNTIFSWQLAHCTLPFKDINWSDFVKYSAYFYEEKEEKIKQIPKTIEHYKTQIIQHPSERLKTQKRQLYDKYQIILNEQVQAYNQIKIIHFEIRRLSLLMNLRGYLGKLQFQHKELKCVKVGLMISKYCYLKSQEIKQRIGKNKIGVYPNFGVESLTELIKPIYEIDKTHFIQQHYRVFSSLVNTFFPSDEKKEFYQAIKSDKIQSILACIEPQVTKLYDKIKKAVEIEAIQFVQFFDSPLKILQIEYKPSDDQGLWRQWHNLGGILEYASKKS